MLKVLASSSNLLQPDQAHFRRITVSIGTGSVPFVVVVVDVAFGVEEEVEFEVEVPFFFEDEDLGA